MRRNRRRPIRRRRARRNPVLSMAGQAVAGFGGFLAGRALAAAIARSSVVPESIRPHAALVGTGGACALAYYLLGPKGPKFVPGVLKQYRVAICVGAGISVLDVLLTMFAPASLQQYVSLPAPAMAGWPGSMQSYMHEKGTLAEYVPERMGEYIPSMGEYVPVDEDGVPMGDVYNLDAGVIEDGLYGDPSDDALDVQVLD